MAVLGREGFEIHWIYQPVPILWLCYESLENIWFECKIPFNFKYDLMTRGRGVVWIPAENDDVIYEQPLTFS